MAAVRRATAFAFARVLAFAAVVTCFTATLAFASILTLAGVLIFLFFLAHFERYARFAVRRGGMRLHGERSAHQTGDRRTGDHCFRFHFDLSLFVWSSLAAAQYRPGSIKLMKIPFINQCLFANALSSDADDRGISPTWIS